MDKFDKKSLKIVHVQGNDLAFRIDVLLLEMQSNIRKVVCADLSNFDAKHRYLNINKSILFRSNRILTDDVLVFVYARSPNELPKFPLRWGFFRNGKRIYVINCPCDCD